MIGLPQRNVVALHELAARVLERYASVLDPAAIARDVLDDLGEVLLAWGLDDVVAQLDVDGGRAALVALLGDKAAFDPRGPRQARAGQLVACLLRVFALEPVEVAARTLTLPDAVRGELAAAIAPGLERALGLPQLRERVIENARARCAEVHRAAFDKIAAHLDERGMKLTRQPKVPLDAMQDAQHALAAARDELVTACAREAVEVALPVLARASTEAAARLAEPVAAGVARRDVVVRRALDPRVTKTPAAVAAALIGGIADVAELAWAAAEQVARPYAASQTFAVGELIEHPKFGRGTVATVAAQRIEVEFADGTHTLVHARR